MDLARSNFKDQGVLAMLVHYPRSFDQVEGYLPRRCYLGTVQYSTKVSPSIALRKMLPLKGGSM
jgi:hypothetical protein